MAPAILLDRDGVLNVKATRKRYVTAWSEFQWAPGARQAIKSLNDAGYRVIVVTNQAGIGRGEMTEDDLRDIHRAMQISLAENGARIDAFYYCPHHPEARCECRKPKPGMLFQAQRDFGLDLSRTYFVGDDASDVEAGAAAGAPTLLVTSEWPLIRLVDEVVLPERLSEVTNHR